jgi:hypothetical protein
MRVEITENHNHDSRFPVGMKLCYTQARHSLHRTGSLARNVINPLKPSGNYMYHLFTSQWHFILYLWVSYDYPRKQGLFP